MQELFCAVCMESPLARIPFSRDGSRRQAAILPGSSAAAARRRVYLVFVAIAAGGCAVPTPSIDCPHDTAVHLSPREYPLHPARIVESEIGGNVTVIVDTGSFRSVLAAGVAKELGLSVQSYWVPRALRFALGTQYTRHYVTVERLEFGGIGVGQLELPLADLEPALGPVGLRAAVLGCEVLRQCRIFFDGPSGEMLFLAARSPCEIGPMLENLWPQLTFAPVDVSWVDSRPFVAVSLGTGRRAQVLLDTGAIQSSVSEELTRAWGLDRDHCFIDGLEIGPWRIRMVAPVKRRATSGALGFDVLSQLKFLWDGPGNKLWIAAPCAGDSDTIAVGWCIDQYLRDKGLDAEP